MDDLIADYERRLETIRNRIEDADDSLVRFKIMEGCYKTFLAELRREKNKKL